MADHRQDYSPSKLFVNGQRMTDDYTVEDAVAEYLRLHPEADETEVRAEIEKVAA
jgi:hypothetical protein